MLMKSVPRVLKSRMDFHLFEMMRSEMDMHDSQGPFYMLCQKETERGVWMAQVVQHSTSAHVMISQFVSSNPMSGSVLTAWSLKPASDSVSPSLSFSLSLSLCPSPTHAFSLSLKKINIKKIKT